MSTVAAGSRTGSKPFLSELLKKMSPKFGAITERMPNVDQAEHGGFARRADAEIAAGDRDHRVAVWLLIEDVVGLLRAVGIEAPIVQENLRETRTARHFVEAGRTNLIGVDIRFVERHGDTGQN